MVAVSLKLALPPFGCLLVASATDQGLVPFSPSSTPLSAPLPAAAWTSYGVFATGAVLEENMRIEDLMINSYWHVSAFHYVLPCHLIKDVHAILGVIIIQH